MVVGYTILTTSLGALSLTSVISTVNSLCTARDGIPLSATSTINYTYTKVNGKEKELKDDHTMFEGLQLGYCADVMHATEGIVKTLFTCNRNAMLYKTRTQETV